jgi:EmrB/QacA subfamily drug resistance transporter
MVAETLTIPRAKANTARLATVGLMLGMLLSVLDQAVVTVAIPSIAADLGGLGSIGWVVTAYLLGTTVSGTLYGRLSDRFGRRSVFLTATTLFMVASALCGAAQTMPQLIAARALQGIGAGALFIIPTIAIAELYPVQKRGRMQGLLGSIFAIASVGGPLAGGAITDLAGWRWIFYVNLPLGLIAIVLTAVFLRLPRPGGDARIDVPGAALLVSTIVPVLLATEWGGRAYAWTSPPVVGLVVAALIALAAFLWRERRAPNPILPLRLLSHPALRVALPATLFLGAMAIGAIMFLPTFLQAAYGIGPTKAGLAGLPYVLTFVAVAAVAGSRAGASGRFKPYLLAGSIIAGTGFWLLSRTSPDTAYVVLAAYLAVLGIGFGLIMQNLLVVAQNAVPPHDLAVTTSTTLSLRSLGMSFGGGLFGNLLTRELAGRPQTPEATANAIPSILVWGIPLALALITLIALLPTRNQARKNPGRDEKDDPDQAPQI